MLRIPVPYLIPRNKPIGVFLSTRLSNTITFKFFTVIHLNIALKISQVQNVKSS